MEKKKVEWVESSRCISCLAVVMIHVIAGWLDNISPNMSIFRNVLDNVIFQVLIRYAIPIFIMISGYLLLNPIYPDILLALIGEFFIYALISAFILTKILYTKKMFV